MTEARQLAMKAYSSIDDSAFLMGKMKYSEDEIAEVLAALLPELQQLADRAEEIALIVQAMYED